MILCIKNKGIQIGINEGKRLGIVEGITIGKEAGKQEGEAIAIEQVILTIYKKEKPRKKSQICLKKIWKK